MLIVSCCNCSSVMLFNGQVAALCQFSLLRRGCNWLKLQTSPRCTRQPQSTSCPEAGTGINEQNTKKQPHDSNNCLDDLGKESCHADDGDDDDDDDDGDDDDDDGDDGDAADHKVLLLMMVRKRVMMLLAQELAKVLLSLVATVRTTTQLRTSRSGE